MSEQLDTIIELLREITGRLSSIEDTLNRLESEKKLVKSSEDAEKKEESQGYIRGAAYYADLEKRKQ